MANTRIVVVTGLMAGLTLACGQQKTQTYVAPGGEGKIEVTSDSNGAPSQVTVSGPQGAMTIKSEGATIPEAFASLAYPGATVTTSGNFQGGGQADGMQMLMLHTTDASDKVVEFYKGKLSSSQVMEMNMPTGRAVVITALQGEEALNVTVASDSAQGGVMIQIAKTPVRQ